MLKRDRYFWVMVILSTTVLLSTYLGESYFLKEELNSAEWHPTLVLLRGVSLLLVAAIASWKYGYRTGLGIWTLIWLMMSPHIIIETTGGEEGIAEITHYAIIILLGIPVVWFASDRQRVMKIIEASRKEINATIDNAPVITLVVDQECRVHRVNRSGAEFASRPIKELLGLHAGEVIRCLYHSDDHSDYAHNPSCQACAMRTTILDSFATGKTHYKVETTLPLSSREEMLTVLLTTIPITLQGEPRVLVYIDDITGRKKAEEAVRRSEERLSTLMEKSADGIIILQDGLVKFINPKVLEFGGYLSDELMSKPFMDFVSPEHREQVIGSYMRRLAGEKVPNIYEIALLCKDGSIIPVEINASLIEYDGKPATLSMVRDITGRKRAEEELKLRAKLLDSANDSIMMHDMDGNIVYFNEQACKMRGYSRDEFKNINLLSIVNDDASVTRSKLENLKGKGKAVFETLNRCKDGSIIQVEVHAQTIRRGDETLIFSIIRDITERKQTDEALKQSYEFNKTVFNSTNDAISVIDVRDYTIVAANAAYLKHLGLKEEEVIGRTCYKLTHNLPYPCTGPDDLCPLQETLASGEYARSEHKHCVTGGHTVYVDVSASPIRNNQGEIIQVVHVSRDITQRKKTDEALRKSEASLREAQRIAHLGNWEWDIINNKLKWSEELFRIFGMEPRELAPEFKTLINLIHPGDKKLVQKTFDEALLNKKPYSIDYRILRPDGSERIVHDNSEIVADEAGNPVRIFGTLYDLTERRKMEEQLIVTDRLASIGELVSGVAHEINNPLTSVIGFSELLIARDIPEDIREDLGIINKEARRTAQIVKNLLSFARRHTEAKDPTDINKLIEQVLELRAHQQKTNNINVDVQFAPGLPKIMADGFQLQQVFLNLIINAEYFMIEAHKKGNLTITTERKGNVVKASFADDGPGIPGEIIGHVFDPFFTTKEVGKGTGLGLSICYGIITGHGGRIYAKSEPGKGATLIIELPVITGNGGEATT